MGQDKGSMIIQDKPMIKHILSTLNHHIDEAIIVLNDKSRVDRYSEFINSNDYSYQITFLEDKIKNKGPLPGIMTGLGKINSNYALVLPCDSPYVSEKYIETIFSQIDVNYQAPKPIAIKIPVVEKAKSVVIIMTIENRIIARVEHILSESEIL